MGRLDPAESGEEGGGTIEGKGTSFYFHQGQNLLPDIIYPRTRAFKWQRGEGGESIFRGEAGRIIGITGASLFEFWRFSTVTSPRAPRPRLTSSLFPSMFREKPLPIETLRSGMRNRGLD